MQDALSAAEALAARFDTLCIRAMTEDNADRVVSWEALFLWAALARAKGLHSGIVREIRADNPHAVFPLIRTYVELDGQILYVTETPDYMWKLMSNPRDTPRARGRVSFQRVMSAAASRYPGIKRVYEELSEFGHFGSSGVFASITVDDENPDPGSLGTLKGWTTPGWRDPRRDPLLASAWLVEADEMALREATRFVEQHVIPANRRCAAEAFGEPTST